MGLRPGPIQEGSQPGPRLDRKARARKDPKAHSRHMSNQACTLPADCKCAFATRLSVNERQPQWVAVCAHCSTSAPGWRRARKERYELFSPVPAPPTDATHILLVTDNG
eukprot:scaffold106172_cov54-Phaeocystis_antarctica.AAC.1